MNPSRYMAHLFGGFELRRDSVQVELSKSGQRLVVFLALSHRPLPRRVVSDALWPDADDPRAQASLRTTLWRLHGQVPGLVQAGATEVGLDPAVWVDVRALEAAARAHRRFGRLPDVELLMELRGELVPGCWDSWLVLDRERLRYEALHLLESASVEQLRQGEFHLATMLALRAVGCDPLRESANVLLVQTHLAAGETVDAVRHARRYAARLEEELGISPPHQLDELLWKHRRSVGAVGGRPPALIGTAQRS